MHSWSKGTPPEWGQAEASYSKLARARESATTSFGKGLEAVRAVRKLHGETNRRLQVCSTGSSKGGGGWREGGVTCDWSGEHASFLSLVLSWKQAKIWELAVRDQILTVWGWFCCKGGDLASHTGQQSLVLDSLAILHSHIQSFIQMSGYWAPACVQLRMSYSSSFTTTLSPKPDKVERQGQWVCCLPLYRSLWKAWNCEINSAPYVIREELWRPLRI